MIHLFCGCDPDRSLCGLDLSGYDEEEDDDATDCVVCDDLRAAPCERCGA